MLSRIKRWLRRRRNKIIISARAGEPLVIRVFGDNRIMLPSEIRTVEDANRLAEAFLRRGIQPRTLTQARVLQNVLTGARSGIITGASMTSSKLTPEEIAILGDIIGGRHEGAIPARVQAMGRDIARFFGFTIPQYDYVDYMRDTPRCGDCEEEE